MQEKSHILLILIILFILASGIWILNCKLHFNGFFWNDSHDYKQIAKNIYNGNGFKTSTLRPISFLQFKQLPHPEVARPPIYPHILAGFFMIFGVNDFTVVLCNGIFYVIAVVLTFLVAIKLSNSYKIALFATITVVLSKFFLYMSIAGSSDIVYE